MSNQVNSLLGADRSKGSFETILPMMDFSAISRLASNTICTASLKLSRACVQSLALSIGTREFLYKSNEALGNLHKHSSKLHSFLL